MPKDDLHKYINAKEPLYRSFYLYDESALDIASAKNSIKDYDGLRYVDNILLDIDKKDNSDEVEYLTEKRYDAFSFFQTWGFTIIILIIK